MQEFIKRLEEIKGRFKKSIDKQLDSDQDYLSAKLIDKWEACITVIDKCIDIFKEANNSVVSDVKFLTNLCNGWEEDIPKGLLPMDYATLTHKGDMEIKERFDKIREYYVEILDIPKQNISTHHNKLKNWADKLGAIE